MSRGQFVDMEVPPGMHRKGTEYASRGLYYYTNLVRFHKDLEMPLGGWEALTTAIDGTVRAAHIFSDNNDVTRMIAGSEQGLFSVTVAGAVTDITPIGWVDVDPASGWSIDSAGEVVLAVNEEEGVIYKWQPGDTTFTALAGAPSGDALFITEQDIPIVLGAAGTPRLIQWPHADDFNDWTPSPADLAGDLGVASTAKLMQGMRVRGGSILLSEDDCHTLRWLDQPDVYGTVFAGNNCGAVSRHGGATNGDLAWWMSTEKFFQWNGYPEEIECTFHDYIFGPDGRMNQALKHLARCGIVARFNEVWWLYAAGNELDSAIVYNYKEGHWVHHVMDRTAIAEARAGFDRPLMVASGGIVYEHEKGQAMPGNASDIAARSGPVELGKGQYQMKVRRYFPDEKTRGDLELYFHVRNSPNGAETTYGPYQSADTVDMMFTGRQVAVEYRQAVANDWRRGKYRFEVKNGGRW